MDILLIGSLVRQRSHFFGVALAFSGVSIENQCVWDEFNLYYGCIKGTSYRWLDILKLYQTEFPSNTIHRIRYFTARVQARPSDPQ